MISGNPVGQAQQDTRSHRILTSAGALGALTLVTLCLTFVREMVIAAKIGAGADIDAYLVAALYPTLLASVFASTFGSTLVPAYHRASLEGDLARNEYVSAAWTLSVGVIIGTALLLVLSLRPLLQLAAPGFADESRTLTYHMALLLLPTGICNALVAFQAAVLNARRSFVIPALATPLNTLAVALGVLLLSKRLGVFAIAYGSFAGALAGLVLVTIASIRSGVKLRLVTGFLTVPVKRTARLAAPLLVGVIATFATVFVDRAMASSLGPGSIAALGYADKVVKIPETVIMGALPVVLFPYLSQAALTNNSRDLSAVSGFGLNLMVLVLIPVTVFCVTLSGPIVSLLFQRGKFDLAATQLTATALSGYAVGLTFNGMGYVFPRILLAVEKNYVIALLGCGNVLLKVIYNTLLIPKLGQAGIALGTSLMYATTDAFFIAVLLYYGIRLDFKVMMKGFAFGLGLGAVVLIISFAVDGATDNAVARVLFVGVITAGLPYLVYRSRRLRSLLLPPITGV